MTKILINLFFSLCLLAFFSYLCGTFYHTNTLERTIVQIFAIINTIIIVILHTCMLIYRKEVKNGIRYIHN